MGSITDLTSSKDGNQRSTITIVHVLPPTPCMRERGGGIYSLSCCFRFWYLIMASFLRPLCSVYLCLSFIPVPSWMMISQYLSKYSVVKYTANTYVYFPNEEFSFSQLFMIYSNQAVSMLAFLYGTPCECDCWLHVSISVQLYWIHKSVLVSKTRVWGNIENR